MILIQSNRSCIETQCLTTKRLTCTASLLTLGYDSMGVKIEFYPYCPCLFLFLSFISYKIYFINVRINIHYVICTEYIFIITNQYSVWILKFFVVFYSVKWYLFFGDEIFFIFYFFDLKNIKTLLSTMKQCYIFSL